MPQDHPRHGLVDVRSVRILRQQTPVLVGPVIDEVCCGYGRILSENLLNFRRPNSGALRLREDTAGGRITLAT
jgi:hypothetical protein